MFGFLKPTTAQREAEEHQREVGRLISQSAAANAQPATVALRLTNGVTQMYKPSVAKVLIARKQAVEIPVEALQVDRSVLQATGLVAEALFGRPLSGEERQLLEIGLAVQRGERPAVLDSEEAHSVLARRRRKAEDELLARARRLAAEEKAEKAERDFRQAEALRNREAREERAREAAEQEQERAKELKKARAADLEHAAGGE